MFRIFILTLWLFACNSKAPETNYIYDFENILSPDEEQVLQQIIQLHEYNTTNEIAIVTTPNWGDKPDALTYAVDFGNQYGVGKKKKNNGVVVVVSKELREMRISTGYGIENLLTDEEAKFIIDNAMIPSFKDGNFYLGIKNGLEAIIEQIAPPEKKINDD